MKHRIFSPVLLVFSILLPVKVSAYPQVEMQACLNNAIRSVAQKGLSATASQVKNYCHCSLKGIIDEGRDINQTLNYCNAKYINR
jgi:hypothetical protein